MPDEPRPRGTMKRWYETNCGLCGKTEWFTGAWDARHRGMELTGQFGWVHRACLLEHRAQLRTQKGTPNP